MSNKHYYRLR